MTVRRRDPEVEARRPLTDEVEAASGAFHARPGVIEGLEALLRSVLGVPVSHERCDPIVPPRSTLRGYLDGRRSHARHRFRLGRNVPLPWSARPAEGHLDIFVAARPARQALVPFEKNLGGTASPDFRVPHFIGSFLLDGFGVSAWEHVEGRIREFYDLALSDQARIVRAIAGINALPPHGLKPRTRWVRDPVERFRAFFAEMEADLRPQWTGPLQRLERLRAHPGYEAGTDFSRRLVPAHNDFNRSNVFVLPGRIVVFDWESASLNAPGADLRILISNVPENREPLLDEYLRRARELGLGLDRAEVERNFEIIEASRFIARGWQWRDLEIVERGLDLLERHFPPHAGASATALDEPRDSGETVAGGRQEEVGPMNAPQAFERPERTVREPGPELLAAIDGYIAEKGRIYAPIAHPALAHLSTIWKDNRFEMMEPHLAHRGGTALDIGSHWGYMASRLEDIGYRVTANEKSRRHLYFLEAIRDASCRSFAIMHEDILKSGPLDFDVVVALNVFHHFLKTDEMFEGFKGMLARLDCRMMIYQSHRVSERPKLDLAGHFMEPDEMAGFIARQLRLDRVETIGIDGGRNIYKLSRAAA